MYKYLLSIAALVSIIGCNQSTKHTKITDVEKLTEQKCSMCHNLDMQPNTTETEKAPPLYTVTVHLKDWMKTDNPSELKGKFVGFVTDYVINPSLDKSYCTKDMLKLYGLMPSQKGNVTPDEVEAIANYIFDKYDQEKLLAILQEKARIQALPLHEQVLQTHNCKMCHNPYNDKTAPSYKMIAQRYKDDSNATAILKQSITQGSHGKWKNYMLPMQGYQDIKPKQLDAFIEWILQQDKK
jgi:cytochrome c